LRDMPGASAIENAWLAAGPGHLTGKDAETAACDALTIPVVTGHADMTIIDQIIHLALAAHGDRSARGDRDDGTADASGPDSTGRRHGDHAGDAREHDSTGGGHGDRDASVPDGVGGGIRPMSPEAWQALRYAIARLAIDFVSGPGNIASVLRTGLLTAPFNT